MLHTFAPRRRAAALTLAVVAACSLTTAHAKTPPATERTIGYLAAGALPDSVALVPPPPAADSAGQQLDDAVNQQALALRDTPRFQQAHVDADLSFPVGANQFTCALGVAIDADNTPALYRLLERTRADASAATRAAKNHYQRPRPFTVNGQATCTPDDEEALRGSGSYPSGHTAIGWAWALILSEVSPEQADALQARGRTYGESRLVCNVHWASDVVQGRFLGAAVVARLHDNPEFVADLYVARREISLARVQAQPLPRDCAAEQATLKLRPLSAP